MTYSSYFMATTTLKKLTTSNGVSGAHRDGSISLYTGPMFSGKTTEIMTESRRYAIAGDPVVAIKYAGDDRYERGAVVAAHSEVRQGSTEGDEECAPIRVVMVDRLADVVLGDDEVVVAVDEGQFYPDLPEVCERWANEGRTVLVAALDGNFERKTFGRVHELVPKCEHTQKLPAVCMKCRRRGVVAAFTKMKEPASAKAANLDGIAVNVGGKGKYMSVCRRCYFE